MNNKLSNTAAIIAGACALTSVYYFGKYAGLKHAQQIVKDTQNEIATNRSNKEN
jgi:hypothetical protein